MEIRESKQEGVVIVALQGRLDASNAGDLEAKLLALLTAGEKRLVIDCSQLDYISSAGLRVLLVIGKRLLPAGGTIAPCALQPQIADVFDIAGLASVFSIYNTQDEALAALRSA